MLHNRPDTPLRHFWRIVRGHFRRDWLTLLRGRRSLLARFRCGRGFAPALRLWQGCGWFANDLSRKHAGYKELLPMIIKINGGALRIGGRYDTQAVNPVLDGLSFLHYLHNFLLDFALLDVRLIPLAFGQGPRPLGDLPKSKG